MRLTCEWVMSHIQMRNVPRMDESLSHMWMSDVTCMNESLHARMTRMNESCHTYEWFISHIWMSHVTHVTSLARRREHFQGLWRSYLLLHSLRKRWFSAHQSTRSVPTVIITVPHHALWCNCENKEIYALTPYTYTRWRETLFFFGLISTVMVTPTVHWGVVNRIASLRKRHTLFLNAFGSNPLQDSETNLWWGACVGVSLDRRQDFCAPQARIYAPQSRIFGILMGRLSYWYHVILSMFID